ncbi:maltokinase N-terminal cap-like domain-containing protein [Dietzia sp.]|uniref:maltokinase N-terminal cap-like domain-containing protein n=1 Tax=Dietzia sp. TaxID=1871616 RepID=UPI002FD8C59B
MADIYTTASLNPSKPEAIAAALRSSGVAPHASTDSFTQLASYRFDDPAGGVGMEIHIVRDDEGRILQVPLTYRGAPLDQAVSPVVEMDHSILGRRWVYLGLEDPVFRTELARTIAVAGSGAEFIDAESGNELDAPVAAVRGTGIAGGEAPSEAALADLAERLVLRSVLVDADGNAAGDNAAGDGNAPAAGELLGTWPGHEGGEVQFAAIPA